MLVLHGIIWVGGSSDVAPPPLHLACCDPTSTGEQSVADLPVPLTLTITATYCQASWSITTEVSVGLNGRGSALTWHCGPHLYGIPSDVLRAAVEAMAAFHQQRGEEKCLSAQMTKVSGY